MLICFFYERDTSFFSKKKTFFPFAFSPFGPPFEVREAYKVQCDLFEKKKKNAEFQKFCWRNIKNIEKYLLRVHFQERLKRENAI